MSRALAALAGAGLGVVSAALTQELASSLWPLTALVVERGAIMAGGIAALAAGFAPGAWSEGLRRRQGRLMLLGIGATLAAVAAAGTFSRHLRPAAGPGPLPLAPLHVAALVIPIAAAGIALTVWCDAAGRKLRGWFVVGIGAGVLGAALLAGPLSTAIFSPMAGRPAEFVATAGGAREISTDRGLRSFAIPPERLDRELPLPEAGGTRHVLIVGLADGAVLARLASDAQARITILEEDEPFARGVLAQWPALEQSRAAGRLTVLGGSERWALARLTGSFNLIVVGGGWSEAAYRSRALSHRADYRWTAEAFAGYLARLEPQGFLLLQRTGIPRAVATLREASGLPPAEFGRRVIVFGRGGGIGAECWYGPAGLDTRKVQAALRRHGRSVGLRVLYTPQDTPPGRNFYLPLIRGERPRGLAFSTPLDLSPTLDERPFFDHAERLMLSPRVLGMPEEIEPRAKHSDLRIILAADRALWRILFVGVALFAAALAWRWRAARRAAAPGGMSWGAALDAISRGAAAGLLLPAFAAWAGWLAPTSLAAGAALAAFLVGFGGGWARVQRTSSRWQGCAPAAALAMLLGVTGYRALPFAIHLGPMLGTALLIAVATVLGAALGYGVGAQGGDRSAEEAASSGVGLAAASLMAVAATLAAPHFGYPLLWVLGALALLAPALGVRPRAAGAAGAAT